MGHHQGRGCVAKSTLRVAGHHRVRTTGVLSSIVITSPRTVGASPREGTTGVLSSVTGAPPPEAVEALPPLGVVEILPREGATRALPSVTRVPTTRTV